MALDMDELQDSYRNSPYSDKCYSLLLRGGARWSVHRSVLQKSCVLARLCDQAKDDTLDLHHVPEGTAHVIVHYLYTGACQSLEVVGASPKERKAVEFRSSLSAYAAGRAFALPEIETAARTRVERLGEDLSVPDRLRVAREAYPDPGEDDTWFMDYLKAGIRAQLEVLPASLPYSSFEFLGQMPTFAKAIVKSALEIACASITNRHEECNRSGRAFTASACGSPEELVYVECEPVAVDAYEGSTQVETLEVPTVEKSLVGLGIETTSGAPSSSTPYPPDNKPVTRQNQRDGNQILGSSRVETDSSASVINPGPNDRNGPHSRQPGPAATSIRNTRSPAAMREPTILVVSTVPTTVEDSYSPTLSDIEVMGELYAQHEAASEYTASSPATQSWDFPEPPGATPTSTDGIMGSFSQGSVHPKPSMSPPASLEGRLSEIWPAFPPGLQSAPFPIVWEILRVLLHCSVDPADFTLRYDDSWQDQERCWEILRSHPLLNGSLLPEKSDAQAWQDSIHGDFRSGSTAVIFVAEIDVSRSTIGGPTMKLVLHRLKRDKSCRLYRRFGSDRFLQLLFPSAHSWNFPSLQKQDADKIFLRWLTGALHVVAGRRWAVFWAKAEKKSRKKKKKKTGFGSTQEQNFQSNRIFFFAEDGQRFADATTLGSPPHKSELPTARMKCRRDVMLDWLLQVQENAWQPCLKLFSRISLGLTNTTPTVVLEDHQIIRLAADRESPTGDVMNDGIGRISPNLLRKVQEMLGLPAMTCAVQARIGSAKGMWIAAHGARDRDIGEDWIEVYPSQRKWTCNWAAADEDQRILEVKGWASPLKPATLNTQLLAILDDRSTDKQRVRDTIRQRLLEELDKDLQYIKAAAKEPRLLRKWLHELSSRGSRGIQFLAGLPDSKVNLLSFLVDGGFDPMRQKYLSDLVFGLQEERCEKMWEDLKIKIPQSTNAYMVVDFLGVLKPDEIHICFSTPFGSDGHYDLDGLDVLVARNPAHAPSDIQKVKAVFKPELRRFKDVIMFSLEGDVPLAQKLSGGDYDGDRAWICWDPDIVSSFRNKTVKLEDMLPPKDALSSFFDWNTKTAGDLMVSRNAEGGICLGNLIEEGLTFGLKRSLLGICTKFKDDFCYRRNCIGDKPSILLSWLLGELADEAKKGAIFTEAHWARFKIEVSRAAGDSSDPASENAMLLLQSGEKKQVHIYDYLRSEAETAVKNTLAELHRFMVKDGAAASDEAVYLSYDLDVANYWNQLENCFATPDADNPIFQAPAWVSALRQGLTNDLEACAGEWRMLMSRATERDFRSRVLQVYERWRDIQPRVTGADAQLECSAVSTLLQQPGFLVPEISHWELLKASLAFKLYHRTLPKFLWQIAGRQLQFIKALGCLRGACRCRVCCPGLNGESAVECRRIPVPVIPHVYETLRPDSKYIGKLIGGREGVGSWDCEDDD